LWVRKMTGQAAAADNSENRGNVRDLGVERAKQATAETFAWLNQVSADRAICPGAFQLAHALISHFNYRDEDGWAWPSQATLGAKLGVSDRMVRTYLAVLKERGHLEMRQFQPKKHKRLIGHHASYRAILKPAGASTQGPDISKTSGSNRKQSSGSNRKYTSGDSFLGDLFDERGGPKGPPPIISSNKSTTLQEDVANSRARESSEGPGPAEAGPPSSRDAGEGSKEELETANKVVELFKNSELGQKIPAQKDAIATVRDWIKAGYPLDWCLEQVAHAVSKTRINNPQAYFRVGLPQKWAAAQRQTQRPQRSRQPAAGPPRRRTRAQSRARVDDAMDAYMAWHEAQGDDQ
jgi:hypothetical protein